MTHPGTNALSEGPLGALRQRWAAALAEATERGSSRRPGGHLFVEDREDLTVSLDSRTGLESVATRHVGMVARGPLPEGRSVFRSDPEPEDAAPLFRMVRDGAVIRPPDTSTSPAIAAAKPVFDPRQPAAWLTRIEADVRRIYPAATVRVRWVGADQSVGIGRPGGEPVFDRRRGTRLRAEAYLHRDSRQALAVVERVLPRDDMRVASLLHGVVEALTRRLELRMRARAAPAGETPVVFAPAVGGVLVHELVGHALEGDRALAGSWLARRGAGVSHPDLVVIDDPRRGRMGWRFDDEGESARPTLLLRGAAVRGWLLDQRTAAVTRRRPSGHGRRSSFREPVRPRMGCTFAAAGAMEPDEVLAGMTGVYVRRMEAAHTDPVRGTAVFRVTDSDWVEQGKVMVALDAHLIVVEGVSALAGIDRVANDLEFDTCIGSCHRHAQPLAVSVGAPTFRIRLANVVS